MSDNVSFFDKISIKLASPQVIRSWSSGDLKKAETLNYRTLKPEKDGLFCERIFGPSKDWECHCGKLKGIKFKGMKCDRCGVEVLHSSVRRQRMGHIDLAAPVMHIWFFKVLPSRVGAILDLTIKQLEKIIYYEEHVVVDPGDTKLKFKQLLTEDAYQKAIEEYGTSFTAKIGADAVRELLRMVDLNKTSKEIKKELARGKVTANKRLLKRLKIVEDLRRSDNLAEWMVLDAVPVIPPDLRPLVPLDGGRFASSDLNDLYRRVINRNNRLKKLISLGAPEIIVRNEKRMLQESVDALIENGRHGRAVMGPQNRPLKSLSDMLKGKQGRFRQNLLGKRVDYSGRSVIVVGPELKLHQCGLPKQMALELFGPFIMKKLREKGFVHTIKGARRMVERARVEVWDILEEVIKGHPIMLNRAPTLHRLSIQAFYPKLIEGKAIRLHPLVCAAFNADFDGDQMAVHVPLSLEAQAEAKVIMLAVNNIFSPADGRPILSPSQDMIIGLRYLTLAMEGLMGQGLTFSCSDEVVTAYQDAEVDLQAKIKLRIKDGEKTKIIETTVGRVMFNRILPEGFRYVNDILGKKAVSSIISECHKEFGHEETIKLLDAIKDIGFKYATVGGVSISVDDLKIPAQKKACLDESYLEVNRVEDQYRKGIITERERGNKIRDIWTRTTDKVADLVLKNLDEFNPIFMMADSGARGSKQQIKQLSGMRGLMAKPSGEIIETPITSNFREGLTVLEFFISTHGARKGLADTALKTADAGYLTRRLVDVAQEVIVLEDDCCTVNGITVSEIVEGDEVVVPLKERIVGRVALDNIVDIVSDEIIVKAGDMIDDLQAEKIERFGLEKIRIRSVLTCEAERGICVKCYGKNLASGRLVELGEAVGVIAAQSIGEPGTQLTMRTFHIGGTASRVAERSFIKTREEGVVNYHNLKIVEKGGKFVVLNRNGMISINSDKGIEVQRNPVPQGATILFAEGSKVDKEKVVVRWDPYSSPILTDVRGRARYEDLIDKITIQEEMNATTGLKERVVSEFKGDYHPQLVVLGVDTDEVLGIYSLPTGAHIMVGEDDIVEAGDVIAKTPRLVAKTRDITGGLPRVAELFEARRPRSPAIISEIDGFIEFGEVKGERKIIVRSSTGMVREYVIPTGSHPVVYRGDQVLAGQQLTEGPTVLQDILRVCGDKVLQEYLVNEIQEVYRLQGVRINDKHIEIIIREMLRKIKIVDPGETTFLQGEAVDKWDFRKENEKIIKKGGRPATASPLLLGITKASLSTKSFISSASFQETTRVLADAATAGKIDNLKGLKENVIVGHLVPSGTGLKKYQEVEVEKCQQ
ncbi:MAG: DNA-directed RNA polymerase subunit beta' [Candidatus Omnitrophica bacterium]|nr:DNA-directed RNA polymerase subunit beta' [Candidatus Omnitrophota bacterium]